jgi:ribosomal protein S18 acetylase RimI-like enzyme
MSRRLRRCGTLAGVMVQQRRPVDLPGCVAALAEVHRLDGYPTRWPDDAAGWLSPARLLAAWVAVEAGTVLGHVALHAGTEDIEPVSVSRLFVRPAGRGRRLGEALLSTATDHAASRGLGLVLDVVDEQRSAAIALYERLGWRYAGRRAADWLTPDGIRPRLRRYVLPDR